MAPTMPVASGGIHVWHIPELVALFGDDVVLQFGGGTLLEAAVKARNEGRDLLREGPQILKEAARFSPALQKAMETWKEIKFDYDTVDSLDR